MSIRIKIGLGCLCLTALTIFVGLYAQGSQREIGDLATRLYDNSLLSTNSLRSAQSTVVRLDAEVGALPQDRVSVPLDPALADRVHVDLTAAEADLSIASIGSISRSGRDLVDQTRRRLSVLSATGGEMTPRLLKKELRTAVEEIDAAARVFAADAYDVKGDVGSIMQMSIFKTRIAIGVATVLMILVIWGLSRTIVPALRRAVTVARAIADGNFSSPIDPRGSGEGAELLSALATMQSSIADRLDRFESTVATQAHALVSERSVQSNRLDAALETLDEGLCLFDARGQVVVANRCFQDLFPFPEIKVGASQKVLARLPDLGDILATLRETPSFIHEAGDGRRLAVTQKRTTDGGSALTVADVSSDHLTAVQIEHAANHDGMTGLSNRFALTRELQAILDQSQAEGPALLAVFDILGFRAVNEAFGHQTGDALLKEVAGRMSLYVAEGDILARIGGDDFAFVRRSVKSRSEAEALAESILSVFAQPFVVNDHTVTVAVSVGLARGEAGDAGRPSAETMLLRGEFAQAAAKLAGRNRYRHFEASMEADAHLRRRMEVDLSEALAREEFEIFYQPIIDVPMRSISGFEALLRWRHPEQGMVSPAQFIPVAEDSGLIVPIGLWVLETACRHAAAWPVGLTVAVNLSPLQFKSETLLNDVQDVLTRTGFPAYRLQLEVTEGVFLHNTEHVLATLTAFRRLGIRISMDDFGTGYSSLGYLSRFPFDKVKIDQSFVRDLAKRENLMIVRAIVGLSNAMGLSVMAEGVETRRQMETLLAESCGEMQGYHFAMPMPLSDLPRFMMQFSLDQRDMLGSNAGGAQLPMAVRT